jgi:hypothetical protein
LTCLPSIIHLLIHLPIRLLDRPLQESAEARSSLLFCTLSVLAFSTVYFAVALSLQLCKEFGNRGRERAGGGEGGGTIAERQQRGLPMWCRRLLPRRLSHWLDTQLQSGWEKTSGRSAEKDEEADRQANANVRGHNHANDQQNPMSGDLGRPGEISYANVMMKNSGDGGRSGGGGHLVPEDLEEAQGVIVRLQQELKDVKKQMQLQQLKSGGYSSSKKGGAGTKQQHKRGVTSPGEMWSGQEPGSPPPGGGGAPAASAGADSGAGAEAAVHLGSVSEGEDGEGSEGSEGGNGASGGSGGGGSGGGGTAAAPLGGSGSASRAHGRRVKGAGKKKAFGQQRQDSSGGLAGGGSSALERGRALSGSSDSQQHIL